MDTSSKRMIRIIKSILSGICWLLGNNLRCGFIKSTDILLGMESVIDSPNPRDLKIVATINSLVYPTQPEDYGYRHFAGLYNAT
jgi:hypothetical protein